MVYCSVPPPGLFPLCLHNSPGPQNPLHPSEGMKRKCGKGTDISHIPGPRWYSLLLFPFHSWDFIIGLAYVQRRLGNVARLWRATFQKQHNAMKGEARTVVDSFPHPKQIMWEGLEVAKNVPWDENVQERDIRVLVNEYAGLTACPSTRHTVHSSTK